MQPSCSTAVFIIIYLFLQILLYAIIYNTVFSPIFLNLIQFQANYMNGQKAFSSVLLRPSNSMTGTTTQKHRFPEFMINYLHYRLLHFRQNCLTRLTHVFLFPPLSLTTAQTETGSILHTRATESQRVCAGVGCHMKSTLWQPRAAACGSGWKNRQKQIEHAGAVLVPLLCVCYFFPAVLDRAGTKGDADCKKVRF